MDGGFVVSSIIKQLRLRLRLGLLKPKHALYNLKMAYQITIKPLGLIRDLKTYVHNIPYITTFIILQNNVIYSNYSMLLGRPWLKDVKVAHDWGSNIVTIQEIGTIKTITITKCLGGEIRKPEVLLCYEYQNGIINEEKYIMFVTKL